MTHTEESAQVCARHPKVQTNLTCATCGTPICPDCLVQTPVGMKCRGCAAGNQGTLFRPSAPQSVLAAIAGLAAGAIAGWLVTWTPGFIGLLLAFAYGGFAGQMILRASGRKRGVRMEIIAGLSLAIGALGARILVGTLVLSSPNHPQPPLGVLNAVVNLVLPTPLPLIALVVAIAAAVSRIRYL